MTKFLPASPVPVNVISTCRWVSSTATPPVTVDPFKVNGPAVGVWLWAMLFAEAAASVFEMYRGCARAASYFLWKPLRVMANRALCPVLPLSCLCFSAHAIGDMPALLADAVKAPGFLIAPAMNLRPPRARL